MYDRNIRLPVAAYLFQFVFGFLNKIDNFFNSSVCFMKTSQARETPTGDKNPLLLCCCSRLVFSSAAAYIAKFCPLGKKNSSSYLIRINVIQRDNF